MTDGKKNEVRYKVSTTDDIIVTDYIKDLGDELEILNYSTGNPVREVLAKYLVMSIIREDIRKSDVSSAYLDSNELISA